MIGVLQADDQPSECPEGAPMEPSKWDSKSMCLTDPLGHRMPLVPPSKGPSFASRRGLGANTTKKCQGSKNSQRAINKEGVKYFPLSLPWLFGATTFHSPNTCVGQNPSGASATVMTLR